MNNDLIDYVIRLLYEKAPKCPECNEKYIIPYVDHMFRDCRGWDFECEEITITYLANEEN